MRYAGNVLEQHRKSVEKIVARLKSKADKKGVKLSLKILHNPSVSNAILNYVNSHKHDVIVIGSHGRTGINKLILGSVANEIAHKAKIPVMVVK
jgi:nucleotide-binding universal stress UspA family protein